MSTYARIQSGVVAELFAPPSGTTLAQCFTSAVAAQFVDVTAVSPAPQQGWTAAETGGTWAFAAPPAPPAPTLVQQAVAAQSAGFAITSTGTPALDGTYPTNGAGWDNLMDEALFIASFSGFSTGASTLSFVLPSGAPVTFTATSQVQAVVKAIAMYLTALKTIAATGAGTLPAAAGTIA